MLTAVLNDSGWCIDFLLVNNMKRTDVYSVNIVTSTTIAVNEV